MDESQISYLKQPGKHLHIFEPTQEKLESLSRKLYLNYLWLPDEYRTPKGIEATMQYLFPYGVDKEIRPMNIFYEMGEFQGLLGFVNMIPEYRAELFVKIWDKAIFGPDLAREGKALVKRFMREWKLIRLGFSTPDERNGNFIARLLGLKNEGTQGKAFKFDGKFFTNHLYRRIVEV